MSIPEPTVEERIAALEAAVADLQAKYADAVQRYQKAEKRFNEMAPLLARVDRTDSQAARLPREQRRARAGVDPDVKEPQDRGDIRARLRGTLPAIIGGTGETKGGGTRDQRERN